MSSNHVQHRLTKHIEIDIHFVREKVSLGEVRVLHVPSALQFADIMTKGLPSQLFLDFRSSHYVREPPAETAGGGEGGGVRMYLLYILHSFKNWTSSLIEPEKPEPATLLAW
jgi:hypothetical protein